MSFAQKRVNPLDPKPGVPAARATLGFSCRVTEKAARKLSSGGSSAHRQRVASAALSAFVESRLADRLTLSGRHFHPLWRVGLPGRRSGACLSSVRSPSRTLIPCSAGSPSTGALGCGWPEAIRSVRWFRRTRADRVRLPGPRSTWISRASSLDVDLGALRFAYKLRWPCEPCVQRK